MTRGKPEGACSIYKDLNSTKALHFFRHVYLTLPHYNLEICRENLGGGGEEGENLSQYHFPTTLFKSIFPQVMAESSQKGQKTR